MVAAPDRKKTGVYGVNDAGDVVGVGSDYDFFDSGDEPFIYQRGVVTILHTPAAPGMMGFVSKINAAGQILGDTAVGVTTTTGFPATRVP